MKLWHAWECPFSMGVRITIREKELAVELHDEDLDDVGPEVERRNPKGSVPVLEDRGCSIYESLVIHEYLDEAYPNPPLMPVHATERARARLLLNWVRESFVPHVSALEMALVRGSKRSPDPTDEKLNEHRRQLYGALDQIAGVVTPGPWTFNVFCLVDVYLAPWMVQLDQLGLRRDEVPAPVIAWIDCLRDRPSIVSEIELRRQARAA